jgi:circadian clock protein KaiC
MRVRSRLSTGLAELDLVLGGGLSPGAVFVLAGPPGTGKTILAQQICFANATADHKALFYTTLSESHTKLREHLAPFTFFDEQALGPKVEHIHLGDMLEKARAEGLDALTTEVVRRAMADEPAIVVIDSVKMFRDFVSEQQVRTALYRLTSQITHSGAVLLLLGEYSPKEIRRSAEFSLADGILQLTYQPREPVDRRWMRVVKMRGGSHLEGKHTFRIGPDGISVFARIETLAPATTPTFSGRTPTGVAGLDGLMGGGIPIGDTTLVLGPPGAGKTIGSLNFIADGLSRQERCVYISFQDTADQLVGMSRSFGWDFQAECDAGRLTISHVPMGSLDLDVLGAVVRRQLADGDVTRVVIDSLAEMVFAGRESERFPAYLRSLAGLIRAAGASLLVTSETTSLGPSKEPLGGLMFLFHNVIQLRYLEHESKVERAVNIVKMRNSDHDTAVHLCRIKEGGLRVVGPLDEVTGILGWSTLTDTPLILKPASPLPT